MPLLREPTDKTHLFAHLALSEARLVLSTHLQRYSSHVKVVLQHVSERINCTHPFRSQIIDMVCAR